MTKKGEDSAIFALLLADRSNQSNYLHGGEELIMCDTHESHVWSSNLVIL